ncbi:hypothetical protein [Methylopila sp. Yamaguchi]|uniref:hypothetical protein n=1 Tax=Methylopila sp. Yamaguchi TaxID=1437817 RepID=UPI000CA7B341|nr:hypothetical protein [Methylopila sp. Yamaguchi]GBD49610.1 hypothetical protein METY_2823 [Methylopila sp. Yamaguchi]
MKMKKNGIGLATMMKLGADLQLDWRAILDEPVPAEIQKLAEELDRALAERAQRDDEDPLDD